MSEPIRKPQTRLLNCTCTPPPGKHNSGRQRRRGKHDSDCELVVYVEKLERKTTGGVELLLVMIDVRAQVAAGNSTALGKVDEALKILASMRE